MAFSVGPSPTSRPVTRRRPSRRRSSAARRVVRTPETREADGPETPRERDAVPMGGEVDSLGVERFESVRLPSSPKSRSSARRRGTRLLRLRTPPKQVTGAHLRGRDPLFDASDCKLSDFPSSVSANWVRHLSPERRDRRWFEV